MILNSGSVNTIQNELRMLFSQNCFAMKRPNQILSRARLSIVVNKMSQTGDGLESVQRARFAKVPMMRMA